MSKFKSIYQIYTDMVYLRVKENSTKAKAFLEYVKTISFIEVIDEIPNTETIQAMEDARNGKVTKYKNSKELFSKFKKKIHVQD